MDTKNALSVLGALAHEGRLDLFRLLVRAGPEGANVGSLAEQAGLKFGTASAQLSILDQSGLISSTRDGRSIIYRTEFQTMIDLVRFLMKDCCGTGDSRIEACCNLLECNLTN